MSIADKFKMSMDNCKEIVNLQKKADEKLWFHGTNRKSAKCILGEKQFKCYSEAPKEFRFGKGEHGERDIVWFTKFPTEACEHALAYSKEVGQVILTTLEHKNPFVLNEPVSDEVYAKAMELHDKGDRRFFRMGYAIPEKEYGQYFLSKLAMTDIQKNGKWTSPTFGELIEVLGFDSVIYKGGAGKEFTEFSVLNRKDKESAVGITKKDLITIEGVVWNFE